MIFHATDPTSGGPTLAVRYFKTGVHDPSLYLNEVVGDVKFKDGTVRGTDSPAELGVMVNLFEFPHNPKPMELRGDNVPPV